jgi:NAD(P)-dependent dehydrogenase (short-subunit alcohol dehydrogenase family)
MAGLLADHAAVVTGGASGIGRGICLALADQGADVVVADVREAPRGGGDPTHERVAAETGRRARHVSCDVRDDEDVGRALAAAEALGGLDVWVNNAGVLHHGPATETPPAAFDDVFGVNARATFRCTQRAGAVLAESGGGAVVNVASTSGLRGGGDGAIAAYCASKAAVVQLTRAFADALGGDGVRVNAVCPGAIDTELARDRTPAEREALESSVPAGRVGRPEDVAGACVFLASELAAYVHGEALIVDGGLTA